MASRNYAVTGNVSPLVVGELQQFTSDDLENWTTAAFIFSGVQDINTVTAHARFTLGFCDRNGNQFSWSKRNEDDRANTVNTRMTASTDKCIVVAAASSDNTVAEAEFVRALKNGVEIRWTKVSSQAFLVSAFLVGGNAQTAIGGIGVTGTAEEVIGFRPTLVFTTAALDVELDGTFTNTWYQSGGAFRGADLAQASIGGSWPFGVSTTEANTIVRDDACGVLWDPDAETEVQIQAVEVSANSFTLQSNGNPTVLYLAIGGPSGSPRTSIDVVDIPSSPGLASYDVGIRPQVGLITATRVTSVGSRDTSDKAGSYCWGLFDEDLRFCHAVSAEVGLNLGATITNTKSYVELASILVLDDTAGISARAVLPAAGSTGWAFNYSNADEGKLLIVSIGTTDFVDEPVCRLVAPQVKVATVAAAGAQTTTLSAPGLRRSRVSSSSIAPSEEG